MQALTKLATSKSADSSSTYLHFVIEYILSKPEHSDSVDFYKAFADLTEMTKTSIQEIKAQCDEWQKTLKAYHVQYETIKKSSQVICNLKLKYVHTKINDKFKQQ